MVTYDQNLIKKKKLKKQVLFLKKKERKKKTIYVDVDFRYRETEKATVG